MNAIKVLVVDDSAFMRKIISDMLVSYPDIEVIDTARNGMDAIEKTKRLHPDVVTLDIEMPILDGLSALKEIMHQCPAPVVMLSSHTQEGAEATFKALELGAVDFVAKPSATKAGITDIAKVKDDLVSKIIGATKANLKFNTAFSPKHVLSTNSSRASLPFEPIKAGQKIVVIGTSTGGPRALQEILPNLPSDFPAGVLVVQHMPKGFTKSFAERLSSLSQMRIKEAEDRDVIKPGTAFIAPGDYHMVLEKTREGNYLIRLNQDPPRSGHRPSVDVTMLSAADAFGANTIGVLLTGMGHDGMAGMKAIKKCNGITIAEDRSTAIIFGMPRSAIEAGVVDKIVPLPMISEELLKLLK